MENCGIDVHQKSSEGTAVDEEGEVLERASIPTTRAGLERWFGRRERMRILLEASGSSPWGGPGFRGARDGGGGGGAGGGAGRGFLRGGGRLVALVGPPRRFRPGRSLRRPLRGDGDPG